MKELFSRIRTYSLTTAPQVRSNGLWLAPGLFFILIGLVALIAPRLVIIAVASVFFFIGTVVCILGWKLMQLKSRVEKMAQQFQGQIIVQGVNLQPDVQVEPESDQKKIVFH
ncbi:MAG: hypothetical protein J0M12_14845 [Deltaproteobacteria bacterium]|nr:hypothetical protein [Deltaproteobacteria bacterium]